MKTLLTMIDLVAVGGDVNDPVNFTFFIGCMAMMAASAFFFLSLNSHLKNRRIKLWAHFTFNMNIGFQYSNWSLP